MTDAYHDNYMSDKYINLHIWFEYDQVHAISATQQKWKQLLNNPKLYNLRLIQKILTIQKSISEKSVGDP